MQLKNLFYLILASLLVQSCGNSSPDTLKAKKEQLQAYKEELNSLKSKIKKLEKGIQKADTTNSKEGQLVSLEPVQQKLFQHFVRIRGEAASKKNVRVSPEMNGTIEEIYHSEGDRVKKGEIIAQLDNETIVRNIEQIKTNLEHARNIYQKQKNLWDQNIGSEVEYLQAKNRVENLEKQLASARSQLANTKIKAPISGEIDEIFLNEGEMASPATPICRIINLNDMRVIANVSESHLGKIHRGDTVQLTFPNLELNRKATVSHVGQYINPDSRTFKIEIKIDNENLLIKPNVLATVRFSDYENQNALVMPTKLLQESDKGEFVFTAKKKNGEYVANKTFIETGVTYQGTTEIKKGLQKDDKLIVAGFREVADGEPIRLAN